MTLHKITEVYKKVVQYVVQHNLKISNHRHIQKLRRRK
jgi:hypothetical protein